MRLSPHEERDFEDGEHKARPLVSVRDNDVFVVQSLYGDREASGDQKLMRLLFLSARYATVSAARITALVPYLAYAHKDGKTQPRSVTTRYVASLFERLVILSVASLFADTVRRLHEGGSIAELLDEQ
ncbi:MAG: ribose-phosphate pyrophosphokinase-like domain-containing protein [Sulfurifustaceae bacterium]